MNSIKDKIFTMDDSCDDDENRYSSLGSKRILEMDNLLTISSENIIKSEKQLTEINKKIEDTEFQTENSKRRFIEMEAPLIKAELRREGYHSMVTEAKLRLEQVQHSVKEYKTFTKNERHSYDEKHNQAMSRILEICNEIQNMNLTQQLHPRLQQQNLNRRQEICDNIKNAEIVANKLKSTISRRDAQTKLKEKFQDECHRLENETKKLQTAENDSQKEIEILENKINVLKSSIQNSDMAIRLTQQCKDLELKEITLKNAYESLMKSRHRKGMGGNHGNTSRPPPTPMPVSATVYTNNRHYGPHSTDSTVIKPIENNSNTKKQSTSKKNEIPNHQSQPRSRFFSQEQWDK